MEVPYFILCQSLTKESWHAEVHLWGGSPAQRMVIIGDGCGLDLELGRTALRECHSQCGLYHACQHPWDLTAAVVPTDERQRKRNRASSGPQRGANAIIALRCSRLGGPFEDYWDSRARAA